MDCLSEQKKKSPSLRDTYGFNAIEMEMLEMESCGDEQQHEELEMTEKQQQTTTPSCGGHSPLRNQPAERPVVPHMHLLLTWGLWIGIGFVISGCIALIVTLVSPQQASMYSVVRNDPGLVIVPVAVSMFLASVDVCWPQQQLQSSSASSSRDDDDHHHLQPGTTIHGEDSEQLQSSV